MIKMLKSMFSKSNTAMFLLQRDKEKRGNTIIIKTRASLSTQFAKGDNFVTRIARQHTDIAILQKYSYVT
jgi:hypothetical protein